MPLIHLKTGRFEFKTNITRKYTIIKGDSGVGKTMLCDLIAEWNATGHGLQNFGYSKVVAYPNGARVNVGELSEYRNYVIFIDEGSPLLHKFDTASLLRKSDNYFVIITRTLRLNYIPVHFRNVKKMKTSGKFHELVLYYEEPEDTCNCADVVLCEDSNSGKQFLEKVYNHKAQVMHTGSVIHDTKAGKNKIGNAISVLYSKGIRRLALCYDAAAIGFEYEIIINHIKDCKDLQVFFLDWDSFESYILESELFGEKIDDETCEWESDEQLAEVMLKEKMPQYSKTSLTRCLTETGCKSCRNSGCGRRMFAFDKLIYWKVRELGQNMEEDLHSPEALRKR